MSAPLVLTAGDLRHLATGLKSLSKLRREHGVSPSIYTSEVSITETESGQEATLRVDWRDVDGLEQYVIADRYGS